VCARLGWGLVPGEGWRWAGLALMAGGEALRIWAIGTLGRFFTPVVRTQAGQGVVRRGPYRLLRHPSYTGTFCTLVGVGLAVGCGGGADLLLALPLPAYLYRIHVEERALLAALGAEYAAYMRATWRVVPGIW
jgi:protein-S-isoprenylcysteine O-methyltransferase